MTERVVVASALPPIVEKEAKGVVVLCCKNVVKIIKLVNKFVIVIYFSISNL